jgi:hypothetical protein
MLHQVQITVELLEKLAGIRPKSSAKQQQKQSQLHQQAQHQQQQQQLSRYVRQFFIGVEIAWTFICTTEPCLLSSSRE